MEEERNLQDWVAEIATGLSNFSEKFRNDPAAMLEKRGFLLHESYKERLEKLTEEQKKAMALVFEQLAEDQSPQDLRQIYADWVDQYELLFGWEGLQEEGPRGWT